MHKHNTAPARGPATARHINLSVFSLPVKRLYVNKLQAISVTKDHNSSELSDNETVVKRQATPRRRPGAPGFINISFFD